MQHTTTETELIAVAQQIRDWQKARGLTDTALLKKFSDLGSTKTFTRILDGDVADLDVERWHEQFRKVKILVDELNDSVKEDEPFFDNLSTCSRLRFAATDAMKKTSNARLVIIQGPSGSGKTGATRALAERYGGKIVLAEVDETWKDSATTMLGGILMKLGVQELPQSAGGRLTKLLEKLRETPVVLVLDEAHHLGPKTLNLVKTIINQTMTVVILAAMNTLFKRLECSAYEEARQLTQNRLCERIDLSELNPKDVEQFLAVFTWHNGDLAAAAKATINAAHNRGHLAFVNAAVATARRLHKNATFDLELWSQVIVNTLKRRETNTR
jgi:DNA transposition AAA+ family ATPase